MNGILTCFAMVLAAQANALAWDPPKEISLDEVRGEISRTERLLKEHPASEDLSLSEFDDAFFSPSLSLKELEPLLKGAVDRGIPVGRTAAIAWYFGYGFKKDPVLALKAFRLARDLAWAALIFEAHPEIREGRKECIDLLKKEMAGKPGGNGEDIGDDSSKRFNPIYISMIKGEIDCEDAEVPCRCGNPLQNHNEMIDCLADAGELSNIEAWAKFGPKFSKTPPQLRQAYFAYRSAEMEFEGSQAWYECRVLQGNGNMCREMTYDYPTLCEDCFDELKKSTPNMALKQADLDAADRALNKAYAVARNDAAEDDAKAMLKDTEKAWIRYRDATVAIWPLFHPGATEAQKRAMELTSRTEMSKQRAKELLERESDD
jgi:uncharacterized protein YecT (DUF1311 family)